MHSWSIIILAAGKGTRLGGPVPKPLVTLGNKPLIQPIIEKSLVLPMQKRVIVISDYTKEIKSLFPNPKLTYLSLEPYGTGYCTLEALKDIQSESVLITQADDSYFYQLATLEKFMAFHHEQKANFTVGSILLEENMPYGSLEIDGEKNITSLLDSPEARNLPAPKSVVCGLYAAQTKWLKEFLTQVAPSENGEIGLPSVIKLGLAHHSAMKAFILPNDEWHGVNTPNELALAETFLLKESL